MVQEGVVRAGISTQLLLLHPHHRCSGAAPLAEWEDPLSDGSGPGQRHRPRAGQIHRGHLLRALPRVQGAAVRARGPRVPVHDLPTAGEGAQRGPARDDPAAALPGLGPGSGQHGLCHSQHDPGSLQGGQWPRGHLPMERPGGWRRGLGHHQLHGRREIPRPDGAHRQLPGEALPLRGGGRTVRGVLLDLRGQRLRPRCQLGGGGHQSDSPPRDEDQNRRGHGHGRGYLVLIAFSWPHPRLSQSGAGREASSLLQASPSRTSMILAMRRR